MFGGYLNYIYFFTTFLLPNKENLLLIPKGIIKDIIRAKYFHIKPIKSTYLCQPNNKTKKCILDQQPKMSNNKTRNFVLKINDTKIDRWVVDK